MPASRQLSYRLATPPSELRDLAISDRDRLQSPPDLHAERPHGKRDDLRAIAGGERRLAVGSEHVRAGTPSSLDAQDTDADPRVVPGLDRDAFHTRAGDHHRVCPGEQVERLGSVTVLNGRVVARLEHLPSRGPRVRALEV